MAVSFTDLPDRPPHFEELLLQRPRRGDSQLLAEGLEVASVESGLLLLDPAVLESHILPVQPAPLQLGGQQPALLLLEAQPFDQCAQFLALYPPLPAQCLHKVPALFALVLPDGQLEGLVHAPQVVPKQAQAGWACRLSPSGLH